MTGTAVPVEALYEFVRTTHSFRLAQGCQAIGKLAHVAANRNAILRNPLAIVALMEALRYSIFFLFFFEI